ncbi:MAG: cupin domain-containing protein [Cyanobacteria bacterium P01_D01_bin.1]
MKIDLSAVPVEMGTNYPAPFQSAVEGRSRQRIGNAAGLTNFGINLTKLAPGAQSALRHWHSAQDEFVYVVQGELWLVTDDGEQILNAGEMAGFAAGVANAHYLVNRSDCLATYLEIGDRTAPDRVNYPDHDLRYVPNEAGSRVFVRKNGHHY